MKILSKKKQTKVSKKLADVINCVFNNSTVDASTFICVMDNLYDVAYIVGGISLMDRTNDGVMKHLRLQTVKKDIVNIEEQHEYI